MERSDPEMQGGGGSSSLSHPIESADGAGNGAVDELLTPGEVARLFGVDPKTVSRWADNGKLDALRTLGGHRRYRAEQVHGLLDGAAEDRSA